MAGNMRPIQRKKLNGSDFLRQASHEVDDWHGRRFGLWFGRGHHWLLLRHVWPQNDDSDLDPRLRDLQLDQRFQCQLQHVLGLLSSCR